MISKAFPSRFPSTSDLFRVVEVVASGFQKIVLFDKNL